MIAMAEGLSDNHIVQRGSTAETNNLRLPQEQLEIQEGSIHEDNINYPSGFKLWLTIGSFCLSRFLNGLDLTIVAVAVPSLTNEFKTISDIGWYSAAYGLTLSAFVFFFGKVYTVFSIKSTFIFGLIVFEAGSLLCTFAPNSKIFILGRAVSGLGTSAISGGMPKLLRHCFPLSKQALVISLVGGCQSIGLVFAPVIGGALTDTFTWRACFGVNLPLGLLCVALTAYSFQDPIPNPDADLPLKEKLKLINLLDSLLYVPAISCFLMALQWGGTKFGWTDARIIVMLVLVGALLCAFGYLQYRQGDSATLPPRILKKRSILAGMWYEGCCNGVLAVTEYYLSIYFQGVRGFTAIKSGLLGLPMIIGLSVAFLAAGMGTTKIGYYSPFMFATSILAPVACGLLTTLELGENVVKVSALLGFLGFAIGLGMQAPQLAVQTVLSPKDVPIGGAILLFGGGMGSALWVCASATLFRNRLVEEVAKYSPGTNSTAIAALGLSDIRSYVGSGKLQDVLSGYDQGIVQTLYLPLALAVLTTVGSATMEFRSIKKQE